MTPNILSVLHRSVCLSPTFFPVPAFDRVWFGTRTGTPASPLFRKTCGSGHLLCPCRSPVMSSYVLPSCHPTPRMSTLILSSPVPFRVSSAVDSPRNFLINPVYTSFPILERSFALGVHVSGSQSFRTDPPSKSPLSPRQTLLKSYGPHVLHRPSLLSVLLDRPSELHWDCPETLRNDPLHTGPTVGRGFPSPRVTDSLETRTEKRYPWNRHKILTSVSHFGSDVYTKQTGHVTNFSKSQSTVINGF